MSSYESVDAADRMALEIGRRTTKWVDQEKEGQTGSVTSPVTLQISFRS